MKIVDTVLVYRLSGGDQTSWHGRYHAHGAADFELHFFLEGSGSYQCNRTRYPISGGRLFLSGPREFHSIAPEPGGRPLSWYAILFTFSDQLTVPVNPTAAASLNGQDEFLRKSLERCLAARETVLSVDPNFRFQFEDLLQMARSAEPSLRESAAHLLRSFLYRWFVRAATPAETPSGNRHHVEKALAYMEKFVRERVTIEEIAKKIGLSEEHFIRLFRDEVRMTPHQYFTRLKVEGASALLMSTDKSVGEISDWFGFENQFHFSRIFRKCTGFSPLQYRKTYIQTVDFT